MSRILQTLNRCQNRLKFEQPDETFALPQEQALDRHITKEMAWKLFSRPKGRPTLPSSPKLIKPVTVKLFVTPPAHNTKPLTTDPFEEFRNVAEHEPRFRALLKAKTDEERRVRAYAVPELKLTQPYLSEFENEILRYIYVEGRSYKNASERLGAPISKLKAQRILYYVAFYLKHPEEAKAVIPHCFDPSLAQFLLAGNIQERRFTAKRHPELKLLFEVLPDQPARTLHHLYWENCTLAQAGERMGVNKERVRQLNNKALRMLKYHDKKYLKILEDKVGRDGLISVPRGWFTFPTIPD